MTISTVERSHVSVLLLPRSRLLGWMKSTDQVRGLINAPERLCPLGFRQAPAKANSSSRPILMIAACRSSPPLLWALGVSPGHAAN